MTLPPGKQIARYQLIELIGTGGIASVYQAFDPLFNRIVAIKLMHPSFSLQEDVSQTIPTRSSRQLRGYDIPALSRFLTLARRPNISFTLSWSSCKDPT